LPADSIARHREGDADLAQGITEQLEALPAVLSMDIAAQIRTALESTGGPSILRTNLAWMIEHASSRPSCARRYGCWTGCPPTCSGATG
jgi:hypothetical protein